jgi:hypothetical protein
MEPWIPEDAEWYIADIVLEFTIEHEARNVVHTNMILIRADSPEEAFQKATQYGKAEECTYENSEGKHVVVSYRGLRDVNVVYDALEDGAELVYEEDIDVPEDTIQTWVKSKDRLGIFAPRESWRQKPNYISGSIVNALEGQGFRRLDMETISAKTGLSLAEIQDLRSHLDD